VPVQALSFQGVELCAEIAEGIGTHEATSLSHEHTVAVERGDFPQVVGTQPFADERTASVGVVPLVDDDE